MATSFVMKRKLFLSLALIIVGSVGTVLVSPVLWIGAIALIVFGIYSMFKKTFGYGAIITLIGIFLFFANKFFSHLFKFISGAAVGIGVILLIIYFITSLSGKNSNTNSEESE